MAVPSISRDVQGYAAGSAPIYMIYTFFAALNAMPSIAARRDMMTVTMRGRTIPHEVTGVSDGGRVLLKRTWCQTPFMVPDTCLTPSA